MNAVDDFGDILAIVAVCSDGVEDLGQSDTFHPSDPKVEVVGVFEMEALGLREGNKQCRVGIRYIVL